jgi:DNA-directed RNA polymerase specialized sigma24 family protein
MRKDLQDPCATVTYAAPSRRLSSSVQAVTTYFIDLLATDRPRAIKEFADLADLWLSAYPPTELRKINATDRDDARQHILTSFIERDGRKLTQYKDNGGEFRYWFHTVSRNACIDWIKANARHQHAEISPDEPAPPQPRPLSPSVRDLVSHCFAQLDVFCQLAILLEQEVGDIVNRTQFGTLLGLDPKGKINTDASNRLRYCKTKLAKLVIDEARRRGLDLTEFGAP